MFGRKYPAGAEVQARGGVHFRVWAPRRNRVEVLFESGHAETLQRGDCGYYSGLVAESGPGARYRFRLDGGDAFPDPVSRFQPEGPHGSSEVIDPSQFHWTDSAWKGVTREGQVIYELHVGTFTPEGTFEAARRQLPQLSETGITVIELMPIADFPGRFGWGYDGVGLFAPVAIYGRPDDLRRFVDDAHGMGIGVILDAVYNHVGPEGNYLKQYSEDYFTDRYENEWGEAINFDGENCQPVRDWVTSNAAYWIDEYHLDGLRLDATQQIFDASPENIMTSLAKAARKAAGDKQIFIVAENEPQSTKLARPAEQGGYGLDALWNDDFHHSARVAATGRNEAYYTDYYGNPQEFVSAAKYGYLYQGQRYKWQKKRRGSPGLDLPPSRFVAYIQNHDQIANSGKGERLDRLTSAGKLKAITTLLLLGTATPMLFQGQEFAASAPFNFFADLGAELGELVNKGRVRFLSQFPSLAQPETVAVLPHASDPATFERSKLNFEERQSHTPIYQLHKDLIRLRREDTAFRSQCRGGVDGAVLAQDAFVLRYFGGDAGDRLLFVNFGRDLHFYPAPEPLLAPPEDGVWNLLLSTEDPKYGGSGTPEVESNQGWRLPGNAAVVLSSAEGSTEIENG
jgi:maltooligosyltrehalose trehalohydrolase